MKALEILEEMQYAYDVTGVEDMIGIAEAIKELKQGQENYNKLWDMYSETKKELEELKNRSCKNCINKSFCGVYTFLKSVKNEDDEIDGFNCPQHTREESKQ